MTADEESVQVDAYLDALLAGRFGQPLALEEDLHPELESDLELTAGMVQRALARFHPSFAFEERLAARLRSDAAALAAGSQPGRETPGELLVFPGGLKAPEDIHRIRSGRLRNGAIASGVAGVSLAGAALLVRRLARPATRQPAEVGL